MQETACKGPPVKDIVAKLCSDIVGYVVLGCRSVGADCFGWSAGRALISMRPWLAFRASHTGSFRILGYGWTSVLTLDERQPFELLDIFQLVVFVDLLKAILNCFCLCNNRLLAICFEPLAALSPKQRLGIGTNLPGMLSFGT